MVVPLGHKHRETVEWSLPVAPAVRGGMIARYPRHLCAITRIPDDIQTAWVAWGISQILKTQGHEKQPVLRTCESCESKRPPRTACVIKSSASPDKVATSTHVTHIFFSIWLQTASLENQVSDFVRARVYWVTVYVSHRRPFFPLLWLWSQRPASVLALC